MSTLCESVCICITCVHTHVCIEFNVVFLNHSLLFFLRWGLSWDPESLYYLDCLASEFWGLSCLHSTPPLVLGLQMCTRCKAFLRVLGIHSQVLMLIQHALYPIPSPQDVHFPTLLIAILLNAVYSITICIFPLSMYLFFYDKKSKEHLNHLDARKVHFLFQVSSTWET